MGCSSCKQKKEMTPMTKQEVERLSGKIEKGAYVFFIIIVVFAIYGIYSLIASFL
jgi:hypothetical protein